MVSGICSDEVGVRSAEMGSSICSDEVEGLEGVFLDDCLAAQFEHWLESVVTVCAGAAGA